MFEFASLSGRCKMSFARVTCGAGQKCGSSGGAAGLSRGLPASPRQALLLHSLTCAGNLFLNSAGKTIHYGEQIFLNCRGRSKGGWKLKLCRASEPPSYARGAWPGATGRNNSSAVNVMGCRGEREEERVSTADGGQRDAVLARCFELRAGEAAAPLRINFHVLRNSGVTSLSPTGVSTPGPPPPITRALHHCYLGHTSASSHP
ncbi:hypothetical protein E2C01_015111 [Portunus trituberculatus]|uniref:Uncharacterized protein n=1 Tax=Portunus trituberculatus TaxID=210409 RepID=A0A5B7DM35_PORTR|nr:hypothetical protein [Portunus trituberculatus]